MKSLISCFKSLIAASCILSASTVYAETSLYEVTNKKGENLYLGGTIHLLRPSDFPLPAEYQQAFDKSQMLVLETDLQKASSPEFGQKMMQQMMYTGGKNLSSELRPEVWKELQDYSTANQVPIGQLMQFKPFMVSLMMVIQQGQKSGLTQGVDFYFNQQARIQSKKIGELESADEVLNFMNALNDQDPNQTIIATLRDLKKMDEMMIKATAAWRAGELAVIEKEMLAPMKKEFPEIYRLIVTDRNNKWMQKIEAMFATPEKEMVLVGSLHLVGDDGLLKQLRKKGYKLKPVKAAK
jgi:uncharacterized protein YbaP (TraB family)